MESDRPQDTSPDAPGPLILGVLSDAPLRLQGLQALLDGDCRWTVLPMAELERPSSSQLSVAMLDVGAEDHLVSLLGHLRRVRPLVPVLVLGPPVENAEVMRLVRLGAKGYLNHGASEQELRMALQVVLEGSLWVPRKVLANLLADTDREAVEKSPALTPREREVLQLLVGGRTNRAIAACLSVDEATVKAHLSRLMRKLGVRNRLALTLQVLRQQSITIDG